MLLKFYAVQTIFSLNRSRPKQRYEQQKWLHQASTQQIPFSNIIRQRYWSSALLIR